MNKLYIIITCFLIITSDCFSQIYFPDTTQNQIWEVNEYDFGFCEKVIYKTGNTVSFCQNQYIEIFKCNCSEQNCMIFGYYRVQNEKVYVKKNMDCNCPEQLSYDFSLNVGNSVSCGKELLYFSCNATTFSTMSLQSIPYQGIPRNTLGMLYGTQSQTMNWIEGIGSDKNPFHPLTVLGHIDFYQKLVKVTRDGQVIYDKTPLNSCGVSINVKVYLEGAYDSSTGDMTTELNNAGLIPLSEPFSALGMHIGGETTTLAHLTNKDIVDWVLIELKDPDDPTTKHTRAGLVDKNGNVIHPNSGLIYSNIRFSTNSCRFSVIIHHRNHLAIMTETPIDMASSGNFVDFTTIPLYGTNAAKVVGGKQIMWTGDSDTDGLINAADRSNAWNDRNKTTYLRTDFTMDGIVNAADRSVCWNNRNLIAQLP